MPQIFLVLGLIAGCSKKKDETGMVPGSSGTETKATKAEVEAKTPEDWLVVEDTTYIPVLDDVSRKMLGAQQAYLKKDNKTAAEDTRQGAALLSKESSGATVQDQKRIEAASRDLDKLAKELDNNKVGSVKQLDVVLFRAHSADIVQRWKVADETVWYPYIEEPDQHFKNAHDAFLRKDYKKTAEELRKGEAFLKLEDARATGVTKRLLDASAQELDRLASEVWKGGVKDVKRLTLPLQVQTTQWLPRTAPKVPKAGLVKMQPKHDMN